MADPKRLFQEHCGTQFEKFMDKLHANESGVIELKFWQQKLVNSFLADRSELNLDSMGLLALVRDGSETNYSCPMPDCWGDVICLDRQNDEWACGECGETWSSRSALMDAINEGELA